MRNEKELNKKLENLMPRIDQKDPVSANLIKEFLKKEASEKAASTIIERFGKYEKFIDELDARDLSDDTIIKNITLHKTIAKSFYCFLYKKGIIDRRFRCLEITGTYDFIDEILSGKYKIDNVLCVNVNEKTTGNKYFVTTSNRKIIELVEDFFDLKVHSRFKASFPEFITSFMESHDIFAPNNFNDSNIEELLSSTHDDYVFSLAKLFVIYCLTLTDVDKRPKFYSISMLRRPSFNGAFKNGARPVFYNRFDPVPACDYWMIIPNGEEDRSTQISKTSIIETDFSRVKNKQLRQYLKQWYWSSTASIITKSGDMARIADFLNMFFPDENRMYSSITQDICAAYKSYVVSKWTVTETRNSRVYPVLNFVRYLDNATDVEIDKSCYLYLNNRGKLNKNGAKGVKKEELEKIASYINDHKNDNHNSLCFYTIFHIALNTEFRISQIVSLSTDCVKESMKSGEYVIQSIMKQSGYEEIDQPCARVVKDIIDSYREAVSEERESYPPELKKSLFVKRVSKSSFYTALASSDFSNYLADICATLGLPKYTAKNLRITYITNAKEYAMKNGLSSMTLLKLTNHANMDTVNNHYIQEKIIDALQATIGVIIGDVSIDGVISAESNGYDTSNTSAVANGCGFCQSIECTSQGPSPCQRCKHFFTTISNIPYYRKEIDRLKALNDGSKNPHDAEDIVKLIRLNTYILSQLLNLKGEKDGTIL